MQSLFLFFLIELESSAWVKLGDDHYSVTESGTFEVCVSAFNHVAEDITFTVWLHIEGIAEPTIIFKTHSWIIIIQS